MWPGNKALLCLPTHIIDPRRWLRLCSGLVLVHQLSSNFRELEELCMSSKTQCFSHAAPWPHWCSETMVTWSYILIVHNKNKICCYKHSKIQTNCKTRETVSLVPRPFTPPVVDHYYSRGERPFTPPVFDH